MDKEWVEKQKSINLEKYEKEMESVVDKIQSCDLISTEKKESLLSLLSHEGMQVFNEIDDFLHYIGIDYIINSEDDVFEKYADWRDSLEISHLADLKEKTTDGYYKDCLDSEPVEFDGDIIMTDPIYIAKDPDYSTYPNADAYFSHHDLFEYADYSYGDSSVRKQEEAAYQKAIDSWKSGVSYDYPYFTGSGDLTKIGFSKWINRYNFYGDWTCTVHLLDPDREIGKFTSDSGMVGVFLLDEVLKYNPDYPYLEENESTATIIRNFKGTIQFIVTESTLSHSYSANDEQDNEITDFSAIIVGKGINKVTGERMHFITKQTGF